MSEKGTCISPPRPGLLLLDFQSAPSKQLSPGSSATAVLPPAPLPSLLPDFSPSSGQSLCLHAHPAPLTPHQRALEVVCLHSDTFHGSPVYVPLQAPALNACAPANTLLLVLASHPFLWMSKSSLSFKG